MHRIGYQFGSLCLDLTLFIISNSKSVICNNPYTDGHGHESRRCYSVKLGVSNLD